MLGGGFEFVNVSFEQGPGSQHFGFICVTTEVAERVESNLVVRFLVVTEPAGR